MSCKHILIKCDHDLRLQGPAHQIKTTTTRNRSFPGQLETGTNFQSE